MTTAAETTLYGKLPDQDLVELVYTEEDRLPMEFAQEVITRGKRMIPPFSKITQSRNNWDTERAEWWATIHATFLLGAIGGDETVPALLDALHFSDEFDNDWVYENIPSIFGAIGPAALEPLKKVASDESSDCFLRERAMSSMAAIALRHPKSSNEVFTFIGNLASNEEEDSETRTWAAQILLDFQRKEYEVVCISMVESNLAHGHFNKADIQRSFSDKPALNWYQRNWLDFYSPEEIAQRQKRWENEREAKQSKKEVEKSDWQIKHDNEVKKAFETLGPLAKLVPEIQQAMETAEKRQLTKADLEQQYTLAMNLLKVIQQRDTVTGMTAGRSPDSSQSESFELFDIATDRYGILGWLAPLPLNLAGKGLVSEGATLALAWSKIGEAENFLGDRAVLLAEAGLQTEAHDQIKQCLEQFPDDLWVQIKLGDAYYALDDRLSAERQYREGLEMAETDYDRDGVLERLVPLLRNTGRDQEAEAMIAEEKRRKQLEEDFVDDPKPFIRKTSKVGRNDSCPCGSGRKYKKCCL